MIHGLFFALPKTTTTMLPLMMKKRIMLPFTHLTHLIPWMFLILGRIELIGGSNSPSLASISPLSSEMCTSCRGDNSSCRVIAGIFTRAQLNFGYSNTILSIPLGACDLSISELRPSSNHLTLRRKNGSYIFNGDWRISQPGEYEGFIYKRQLSLESITSGGPLKESLDLVVLGTNQSNPGIKYEFLLPSSSWKESSLIPLGQQDFVLASQPYSNGVRYYHQRRRQQPLAATSRTASYISPAENSLSLSSHRQLPQPILNLYNSVSAFPVKNANLAGTAAEPPELYPAATTGDLSSHSHNHNNGHNNGANNNNLNNLYSHHHHHHHKNYLRRRNHSDGHVHKWKFFYMNCSEPCGGGLQRSIVRCVRSTTGNPVSDHRCNLKERPKVEEIRRCNVNPCPAVWVVKDWSSCSGKKEGEDCGEGHKTRLVYCTQKISETLTMRVAEGACLIQPKPEVEVSCKLKPCNKWITSQWSQCSSHCGNGVRRRTVTCVGVDRNENPPEECDQGEKPGDLTPCNMGPCVGVSYFVSEWSECSQKCGSGIQTRHIVCSHNQPKNNTISSQKRNKNQYYSYEHHHHDKTNGKSVSELETNVIEDEEQLDSDLLLPMDEDDSKKDDKFLDSNSARSVYQFEEKVKEEFEEQFFCDESQRPAEERECFSDKGCGEPLWFTADWGECSSSCGSGTRTRHVLCVLFTRGRFKVIAIGHCPVATKPPEKDACEINKGCEPQPVWFATEWGQCSALCGGGLQKRSVSCRASNWIFSSSLCSNEDRPIEKRSCNDQKCTLAPSTSQTPPTSNSSNFSNGNEIVEDESEGAVEGDKEGNGTSTVKSFDFSKSAGGIQQTSPEIEETDADDEVKCTDEYRNCALVVQARLCRYKYYRSVCCHSCSDAPL